MMTHDPWTDRLSDYLDGDLAPAEREGMERHLATCASCAATLAELRAVVTRAQALDARPPVDDLWPGIAAMIGTPQPRRHWSFSLPQLLAAAIALMVLSGGSVWLTLGRRPAAVAARPAPAAPAGPSAAPTLIPAADRRAVATYDRAIADLQTILAAGRSQLDTATVAVLERNLAIIDRAIADAERALRADPGNGYLNAHLVRTMRQKVGVLRTAAALVSAQS